MRVDLCVYGLHPSTQNTTSFVSQKAQRVGEGPFQGLLWSVLPQLLHLSPSESSKGRRKPGRRLLTKAGVTTLMVELRWMEHPNGPSETLV